MIVFDIRTSFAPFWQVHPEVARSTAPLPALESKFDCAVILMKQYRSKDRKYCEGHPVESHRKHQIRCASFESRLPSEGFSL